ALVAPDGNTVIHEYTPEYPDQLTNISYGLAQYSAMLVPAGATATYHVPTIGDAGLGTDWTDPNFDDSSWDTGETGLGFASGALESGQDIGNPTAAGSYSVSNGVYTVLGDGNDIWKAGDSFYYVYTPVHGDGELIARVVSVELTNNWAKTGVMFRETLDAGSKFSNVLITGANGCRMQERNSTGGSAVSDSSVATDEQKAINAPHWVRLKRENLTTFRGYYSADGVVWTEMAWSPRTIDMAEDCYVGLCVTSHSNGVLCTAEFDNISFGSQVGTDLKPSMLGVNASLWTRIEFEVEDSNTLDSLKLRMKYEDGFVAYLNGQHIAEQNAPASLLWNSTATSDRPIEDSSVFEEFNLMSFIHLLLPKPQKNVLAIHGLNDNPANEEFLILPELLGASNLSIPQYFASPTPGTYNISGAEGIVSDVWFSHKRGFYDTSFGLKLSTEKDDAEIRYTIDGSQPTITHGLTFNYNTDPPINIDTTTTIRAAAVKPGWLDSPVETHTYIFLDDVIQQPTNPAGFPTSGWGYNGPDYEMDPEVVLSYSGTIKNDLMAVPTLSLAMDVNDWFKTGGQGIYPQGERSERGVSAELIFPDGNEGFQIDCAVQIVGGSSVNRWKMDKLSMRLKFKGEWGPTELRFPVFGDKAVDVYDTLVVDARMNNSWAYGGGVGINRPGLGQRDVAQYTRDQFVSDIQNDMGGYGGQGRHVHLYLNGLYWGLYWLHERPDEHFAASYFGGDDEDYDVLKHNSGIIVNGSDTNYDEMFTVANAGLVSDSQYQLIQEYLDVPGLIDYVLTNFYVGNTDWAHHNWYVSRSRVNPASRWLYHSWDAEHVMEGLDDDVTGKNNSGGPTRLHQQLAQNTEYKLLFADHIHRHFFNDGVLTPDGATALYNIRLNDVDRAVVGESARWGDNHRTTPFTRDIEWITERDWLLDTYLQERPDIVFEDLKGRGLYPDVNAPLFSQHGGWDSAGFNITMSSSSGTIYYTTDGNDPREPLTGNPVGTPYSPVILNKSAHVKARVLDGTWSALNEAIFAVGPVADYLRVTEIMYHPKYTGDPNDPNTEFIELKNIGPSTLYLNLVSFTEGIHFTFPDVELASGDHIVVVKDLTAFDDLYDIQGNNINVAGQYSGSLANNGEGIKLQDAIGRTILDFEYEDDWRSITDGDGFSLTIIDPTNSDPNSWSEKESW
ncbi:MAG: chitobiase/beta-hexosaminidase C-terminal domain-containing protein, partial [Planctomycetota bacterium]